MTYVHKGGIHSLTGQHSLVLPPSHSMSPAEDNNGHAQEVSSPIQSDADTVLGSPQDSTFKGAADSEFPAVIPPVHPARTLVLCFDGTGDQYATSFCF